MIIVNVYWSMKKLKIICYYIVAQNVKNIINLNLMETNLENIFQNTYEFCSGNLIKILF